MAFTNNNIPELTFEETIKRDYPIDKVFKVIKSVPSWQIGEIAVVKEYIFNDKDTPPVIFRTESNCGWSTIALDAVKEI
jgi:hypothetical protein